MFLRKALIVVAEWTLLIVWLWHDRKELGCLMLVWPSTEVIVDSLFVRTWKGALSSNGLTLAEEPLFVLEIRGYTDQFNINFFLKNISRFQFFFVV